MSADKPAFHSGKNAVQIPSLWDMHRINVLTALVLAFPAAIVSSP